MDTMKITRPDGRVVEISEGEIARALLAGQKVLIASPRDDWATRVFNAWIDELAENAPADLSFVTHPDQMHIAFSNGGILQVAVIDNDFKVAAFAGRLFDHFKPILFASNAEIARAQKLADYVLARPT